MFHVKQLDIERAALKAALLRLELNISEEQEELLLKHLHLVIEKNKEINLTRISSVEEAIVLHIEDSLSIYKNFSQLEGNFLDLGTGAGYPGIPLAIISGKQGVLLDSVKKKVNCVQGFINELQLDKQIKTCGLRSEELAVKEKNVYSIVTARAVTQLVSLMELASPLLKSGGSLLAMKGSCSKEEESSAKKAEELTGLKLINKKEFTIGEEKIHRSLYVFKKVSKSKVKLPRRNGLATSKPLA